MPDDLRASLLTAAGALLAEGGPEALTVRGIASAAGVSTMGVYSRFGGKEGVVDALLGDGFSALLEAMRQHPPTADPRADLVTCSRAYRRFALDNPTRYQVMFDTVLTGYEPSAESMRRASDSFDQVCDRVQRALDAGVVGGFEAHEIAASVWATCHGLVSLELVGKVPPVLADDDPFERTIEAVIRGFAP
jgi:AcrR family transcriptional regulator